jgi:hypothetical protein
MPEPLGHIVDALGVEHSPDEGELIVSAVVLLEVMDPDGDVAMRIASSDGTSWIKRTGMYRAAEAVELAFIARNNGRNDE